MFNFFQFVNWPVQAFPEPPAPLVIGVLGEDSIAADLDEVVRGEMVGGRPLVIRRLQRVEEANGCQILFISHLNQVPLEQVLHTLRGQSILTVSDGENFARWGGMIGLVNERHRIRLRINLQAAETAGITISSKLLRPAEIVTPEKNKRSGGPAASETILAAAAEIQNYGP